MTNIILHSDFFRVLCLVTVQTARVRAALEVSEGSGGVSTKFRVDEARVPSREPTVRKEPA